MTIPEAFNALLQSCTSDSPLFPPTLLYNEDWLLRLVLDWFSKHEINDHPLNFVEGARWYSEVLLPSAFSKRLGSDKTFETRAIAGAAVGHFNFGKEGETDLTLGSEAAQLVIVEARIFGDLSSETKFFDQAAHNVSCIAEVLKRARLKPEGVPRLGFYLLAPQSQLDRDAFPEMKRQTIHLNVEHRVHDYAGFQDQWYIDWFSATFDHIDIRSISWEAVIETIQEKDPASAEGIAEFYRWCLEFNKS